MKTKELIEHLNQSDPSGDMEVIIPIMGISGSCAEVQCVGEGFDWYNGRVLIHPKDGVIGYKTYKYYQKQLKHFHKTLNRRNLPVFFPPLNTIEELDIY